ncbi:hypothetical protein EVAR_45779_1 [Eumeta japonica]|uniref:Uncharacterized protein n=1 Tax=Eumeta variegata TaxID=151549 RepID=A0A4C1X3V0_EUMVA|nr:hypothetical protein EVAR_45779_1 [Eumeta japonica]
MDCGRHSHVVLQQENGPAQYIMIPHSHGIQTRSISFLCCISSRDRKYPTISHTFLYSNYLLQFYPDLFALNLYYGSMDARRTTFSMNYTLVETVFDLLQELKLSSYS